jgi:hypothetical protein
VASKPDQRPVPLVRPLAGRVAVALGAALAAGVLVLADAAHAAPPIRFVVPYVSGFPLLFPRPVDIRPRWGTIAAADLDHDGRAAIVAVVPSGAVTVAGEGGTRPGWPRRFARLPQPAIPGGAPAIADIDGDGHDEIAVCVSTGGTPRQPVMFVLRADGTDLDGWPVQVPASDPYVACAPGATLAVDLDGDGAAEIVQVLGTNEVWAFDRTGGVLPGWPFRAGPDAAGRRRTINADPVAADVDGDGRPEIIVVESGLEPRVFALDGDGRPLPHFPIVLQEIVDRQAPAAADIDGDGLAEIVQATLPWDGAVVEPQPIAPGTPSVDLVAPSGVSGVQSPVPGPAVAAALHVLRRDGGDGPGWPNPLDGAASWGAVLADLDGDGLPEILQGDGDQLYAFDASGAMWPGFPLTAHRVFPQAHARVDSQWRVADIDGDHHPDFLRALGAVDNGAATLRLAAIQSHGEPLRPFPLTFDGLLPASNPVVVDLTGDGVPEVAILAGEGTNGGWRLLAWNLAGKLVGRIAGGQPRLELARVPPPVSGSAPVMPDAPGFF